MKLIFLAAVVGLWPVMAIAQVRTDTSRVAKPKTIGDVFEEGRSAFFREDFVTAKARLTQVLRANPNHQATIIMLKNIELAEQAAAKKNASVEGQLQRIILPRLDLTDAKVSEVLEFIQIKASEVTKGEAKPNFIIKLDPATRDRTVTLKLSKISLYDALRAVASAASLDLIYDNFAVTITSGGTQAATGAGGVPTAPGTTAPPK